MCGFKANNNILFLFDKSCAGEMQYIKMVCKTSDIDLSVTKINKTMLCLPVGIEI